MRTVIMIDGGYLRAVAKQSGKQYDPHFVQQFSHRCTVPDEYLLRILYYDSPQFRGTVRLPVSGNQTSFQASDKWLLEIGKLERFAVRRGTLGFRGWKPKNIPIGGNALTDADFSPVFEQKGVDMRVGLDIANLSDKRAVDRIVLTSGDTDMIPAMKHARKAGVEVVLIQMPPPCQMLHDTMLIHADITRAVQLP